MELWDETDCVVRDDGEAKMSVVCKFRQLKTLQLYSTRLSISDEPAVKINRDLAYSTKIFCELGRYYCALIMTEVLMQMSPRFKLLKIRAKL